MLQSDGPDPGATPPARAPWPVMVLAHNEADRIASCLNSLYEGEPNRAFDIFVLANGCTDDTEAVTLAYAKRRQGVHLVSIQMPDKCNAWNVFIHQTVVESCPGRDVYFFMDGDARAVPGSLTRLAEGLARHPHAHAASALPASGRSMQRDRKDMLEQRGLVANLYALRGSFVQQLQAHRVKLPLKLEGDDGLIGALTKWDLNPKENGYDHQRIVPCEDAEFTFDSVSWKRTREWYGYWKRAVRYGRRKYEFELLGKRLKKEGLAGLPVDITDLYRDAAQLRLRWEGIFTITNWVALRHMRRHTHEFNSRV
jgi:glycosyltransferase involved in cell wall biosynthesis